MKKLFIIVLLIFLSAGLKAENNIIKYMKKAQQEFDNGKYSLSIEYYRRILQIRPYTKEAYNGLGKVYAALNRDDEALKQFEKAIKIDPNYIDCLNNLVWLYIEREEYDTSLLYINEVLDRDNKNSTARINQIFILLKRNNERQAKQKLEELININPMLGEAYAYLADLLRTERKDIIQKSLKKEWIDRPELNKKLFNLENMIRNYYENAIKYSKNPTYAYIKFGLFLNELSDENLLSGNISYSTKLKKEALTQLSGVKNTSDDINILLIISYLQNDLGEDTESLKILDKILSIDPTHTIALYNKAYVLYLDNRIDESISTLKRLRQIDPEDEIARYLLEDMLIKNKSVDDPERLALSKEHIDIAKKYFNAKQMELSLEHYKRAVRLTPQRPEARKDIANYYYKNQIFSYAEFELNKLLELDPFNRYAKDLQEFLARDSRILSEKTGLVSEPEPLSKPKLKILVIDFYTQNSSVNHWNSGEIVSEILKNRIKLVDGYELINTPGWKIDQQFGESSIDLEATIEELTLLSGARLVIWGNLKEEDKSLSVVYNIMDITSRKKIEHQIASSEGEDRVDNVIDNIIKVLKQTLSPPGKIYKITKNTALVNLGKNNNVKKGSVLYVFRSVDKKIPHLDLRTNAEKNERLNFLGYIKISGALENYSIGEMISWKNSNSYKFRLNDVVFLYGTLFPLDEDIKFRDKTQKLANK